MRYILGNQVIELHDIIISEFWGFEWIKNKWQLQSVLDHIKNDDFYPTLVDKVVHLFFGINRFHCFNDGNKRTSIMVTYLFLKRNGYNIKDFVEKMEDIAVEVAASKKWKDELIIFFTKLFSEEWIPNELEIINQIQKEIHKIRKKIP